MANLTIDGKLCIERLLEVTNFCNYDNILSQFDIIETCKWITDNKYNKVCLQFPDDLLGVSPKIYEEIKNRTDADVYILGDTSYASCCVDSVAAMHVQADAVVHFGHTCFTKSNIPVFTVLPKSHLDIETTKLLLQNFKQRSKICLFYDTEYEHCKDKLIKLWFDEYPEGYIAEIKMDESPNKFRGRVIKDFLGKECPVENIDQCTCLYLGSSGQTMFNFTISVKAADWYLIDPLCNKVDSKDETMWFKRRRFLIEKCKDANTFGILVCKLAGEQTKDIISRLKHLTKVNGKKSYIISVGKPNVAKLANFPEIDIYVMVACPENDLYNNRDFYKPIVYPFEVEVALNSKRESFPTHHITDYDELLPGRKHYCDINHVEEGTDVSLITGKIRETKVHNNEPGNMSLMEAQNWAVENIGHNLSERSWKGLEQKLGETEVVKVEEGRKGIPLQYDNEPE